MTAIDDTLDALLAADATAVSLRFHNRGPDPLALGGVGLTWAKRALVL